MTARRPVGNLPGMPRTRRADEPGYVYHVLNRGNGRQAIFHDGGDFAAFERVLGEGLARYPVGAGKRDRSEYRGSELKAN